MDMVTLAHEITQEKRALTRQEALAILNSGAEWREAYAGALLIKARHTGNDLRLNYLVNAKSGLCSEDCGYCAQSKTSTAPIEKYGMISPSTIMRQALIAHKNRASTFCIAMSGTKPNKQELRQLGETIQTIKR